jgi:hypothetical protein
MEEKNSFQVLEERRSVEKFKNSLIDETNLKKSLIYVFLLPLFEVLLQFDSSVASTGCINRTTKVF